MNNDTSASRLSFLEERRLGVGGSDVPAILGISDYSTPYTVWADKLGLLPPKDDTETMRQGRELEEYVAARFAEQTGLTVRRDSHMFTNPQYPHAMAHIDRRIVGQRAGLECKTCSPFRQGEFGEHEYPPEYYAQCLHYLGVTEWDVWYLAVLVFGTAFTVYEIRREDVQSEIDEIKATATDFWQRYVIPRTAPPMDGKAATSRALANVFKTATDGCSDLSALEPHCIEIKALDDEIKALERQKEQHKQQIKLAMGENARADCGAWVANWKPRKDGVRVFSLKLK